MHIGPALLEDAHAVAQVHVLSWQHAYRNVLPSEFLSQLSIEGHAAMWLESIANGVPELLVAKVQGAVVGFVAFGPARDEGASPKSAEVWAIYLAPEWWSSGVGRALWLAARERMLEQSVRSVSLWVIASNHRAVTFYRAAGFQPAAASPRELTLGGVQVQEVRYVQALGEP
jgi:ribosomal protein S18 acetylase RimI-like enzyme